MVSAQIDRLNKDSAELEQFIKELKSVGNIDRMNKIIQKRNYLISKIAELTNKEFTPT